MIEKPVLGAWMMNKPTSGILVDRARTLSEEIARRTGEIDGASKLPDDIVRQFVDRELVSALVPRRFGGHETSLATAIEIIETVGRADMAAAWVLAFYIGHNWIHCQFPEKGQEEIFANGPSPCSAGVLSPQLKIQVVEGGYRVSGRTGWNSGSPHADWIMGAGMAFDGEAPKGPLCIIAPSSELEIIDTWDVQAMRGSGSWDVVYDDVFVPEHRAVSAIGLMNGDTPGAKLHANPLYSRPLTPIVFAYCGAPFVGGLRGAVDELVRLTGVRVTTNEGKPVKDKPGAHIRIGRAETGAYLAELALRDMVAQLDAPDAAPMDLEQRILFKARAAALVDLCKAEVNEIVAAAGANAFRTTSPLQAVFRNINMIGLHAFFEQDSTMEALGRARLGLDPAIVV